MTVSATVFGRAHPLTRQNGRQKGYRLNTLLTEYSRISPNSEEGEVALLESLSLIPLLAVSTATWGNRNRRSLSLGYIFGTVPYPR